MPICSAPMQLLVLVAPEGNLRWLSFPLKVLNLKHVLVEVLNGMEVAEHHLLSVQYWSRSRIC